MSEQKEKGFGHDSYSVGPLNNQEVKEPFIAASVKDRGGKSEKQWFVEFSCINPQTGKKVRFRETGAANRIKDLDKRRQHLQSIADEINRKLYTGWTPFGINVNRSLAPKYTTLEFALISVMEHKSTYRRKTGNRDGVSRINIFLTWLKMYGYHLHRPETFTPATAYLFMDYLLKVRKVSTKTYNNYLIELRSCWAIMVKREIAKTNPFTAIDKLRENSETHRRYSDEQMGKILAYIRENEPNLYRFCILVMHAVRPIEITRVQCSDFDPDTGIVTIWGENAKSGTPRKVKIMQKFLPYLLSLDVRNYPPNYYMFRSGAPAEKPSTRDYFSKKFKKVKELLGLTNRGYTLYGLKHTVISHLDEMGIGVAELMQFTGIKNLSALQAYLKKHSNRALVDYSDFVPFE